MRDLAVLDLVLVNFEGEVVDQRTSGRFSGVLLTLPASEKGYDLEKALLCRSKMLTTRSR